jgi:uncharacterized membrane protein YeaQ/YmgE (transglycosylase-associated protein family)
LYNLYYFYEKHIFMQEILIICLVGAVVGWLAGTIVDSDSNSLLLDIIIGIVGGYLGYKLFGNKLSLTSNHWINYIITATAGAAILALVIKLIRRAR